VTGGANASPAGDLGSSAAAPVPLPEPEESSKGTGATGPWLVDDAVTTGSGDRDARPPAIGAFAGCAGVPGNFCADAESVDIQAVIEGLGALAGGGVAGLRSAAFAEAAILASGAAVVVCWTLARMASSASAPFDGRGAAGGVVLRAGTGGDGRLANIRDSTGAVGFRAIDGAITRRPTSDGCGAMAATASDAAAAGLAVAATA
jgi:hypothetical protein